jgi:hypothetical protein
MDDSLRIIQYLYGDEVDDPDFPRRVAGDDDLRREFDRLQETKDALDHRPSPSPDADVVDRVVDRAAEAARSPSSSPGDRALDRAARAPDHNRTRRLQNAGAVLALLLALGVGWWYTPGDTAPTEAPSTSSPQQAPTTASSEQPQNAQDAEALPEWDDRDEVVRLHRRIETLRTQNRSGAWGGSIQTATQTKP